MRLHLPFVLALALPSAACIAPVDDEPVADDATARAEQALHSVASEDMAFPAVGVVWGETGCTGTLIGPETVLTAAHCFAALARGCESLADALPHAHFWLVGGGRSLQYRATDIRIAPGAYHGGTCADSDGVGLSLGRDVAVMRIAPDGSHRHADYYARPMDVATRAGWSTGDVMHFHGSLGLGGLWQLGDAIDPVIPWMVGTGARDDCNTGGARRAGTTRFDAGWNWLRDQDDGSYELYTYRDGPAGAVVASGDSGGPLVVLTGAGAGALHDGTANLRMIVGVISHGDPATGRVPCNSSVPYGAESWTAYSATFAPDIGAFLERAMEDFWTVHYYPITTVPRLPLPIRLF